MRLYQTLSVKLMDYSFKSILESFDANSALEELCTVAESTFATKLNPKLVANAASRCQIDKEQMETLISCLALVLEEGARLNAEPKEVEECLLLCGAGQSEAATIAAHFGASGASLRQRLAELEAPFLPEFHSLRWRFDVEIASRCQGDHIVPLLRLQLQTRHPVDGTIRTHLLQTDPNNLRHLLETLEAAQLASDSNRAKRLLRYVR